MCVTGYGLQGLALMSLCAIELQGESTTCKVHAYVSYMSHRESTELGQAVYARAVPGGPTPAFPRHRPAWHSVRRRGWRRRPRARSSSKEVHGALPITVGGDAATIELEVLATPNANPKAVGLSHV